MLDKFLCKRIRKPDISLYDIITHINNSNLVKEVVTIQCIFLIVDVILTFAEYGVIHGLVLVGEVTVFAAVCAYVILTTSEHVNVARCPLKH